MSTYVGRFAPTPSGSLHFGSLVAALGSFLRAKSLQGSWHLRIDDIDTVRCSKEATCSIIATLKNYGFTWDGPVFIQSERLRIYESYLAKLKAQKLIYGCDCTRAMLRGQNGIYPGTCRDLNLAPEPPHAVRLKNPGLEFPFYDQLRGPQTLHSEFWHDDFILKRRDGIFGYNFVTVIDDYESGVTEVVRGVDILDSTPRQITLYNLLNLKAPKWLHLPLALENAGQKLSKQNHAQPIPTTYTPEILLQALEFLGQPTSPAWRKFSAQEVLAVATHNFALELMPTSDQKAPDVTPRA